MTAWQTYRLALTVGLLVAALSPICFAEKLDDVVRETIHCNPEVLMSSATKYARANAVRESTAGYLPKIDIFASYGRDHNKNFFTRLENPTTSGGNGALTLTKREAYMSIKQMLFDGFAVRSEVEANSAWDKSSGYYVLHKVDEVIIEIAAAYIDTIMLRSIYAIAKDNVAYHQRIVDEMSNGQLQHFAKGDLDFAKGRLSLAQTLMLDLQRDIRDAQAAYIKVVGKKPGVMYKPESPDSIMPTNDETAVAVALCNNPLVGVAKSDVQGARAEKRGAKAPYFPRLDLELSGSNNKNVDGYNQNTNSLSAMLQLRYNLFNGGKDIANERKKAWELEEKKQQYNETLREIEQQTRQVWSAFTNYKGQLTYLKQRVDAMNLTHDAYYKEFANGSRDVFEMLKAEEEMFNARANYITAQYKELFSRFMVLQSMGKIREYFHVKTPRAVTFQASYWMTGN
ncbi:MAG TPA: TolC family outer membrane protein [Gammaproteobacteria bacterium]|nr:TolC family outer membrane protein [Gammaproteobacteria bacterium]